MTTPPVQEGDDPFGMSPGYRKIYDGFMEAQRLMPPPRPLGYPEYYYDDDDFYLGDGFLSFFKKDKEETANPILDLEKHKHQHQKQKSSGGHRKKRKNPGNDGNTRVMDGSLMLPLPGMANTNYLQPPMPDGEFDVTKE